MKLYISLLALCVSCGTSRKGPAVPDVVLPTAPISGTGTPPDVEPIEPTDPVTPTLPEVPTLPPIAEEPIRVPGSPTSVPQFKSDVQGRWLSECTLTTPSTSKRVTMSFGEILRNKLVFTTTLFPNNTTCTKNSGESTTTTTYLIEKIQVDQANPSYVIIDMFNGSNPDEVRYLSIEVSPTGVTIFENGGKTVYPTGPF